MVWGAADTTHRVTRGGGATIRGGADAGGYERPEKGFSWGIGPAAPAHLLLLVVVPLVVHRTTCFVVLGYSGITSV